jgi:hypothetical protein
MLEILLARFGAGFPLCGAENGWFQEVPVRAGTAGDARIVRTPVRTSVSTLFERSASITCWANVDRP